MSACLQRVAGSPPSMLPWTSPAEKEVRSTTARQRGLSTGLNTAEAGLPYTTSSSRYHSLSTNITATVFPPVFEYRDVPNKNSKMINYSIISSLDGPQLTALPCSSANLSPCTPTGFLLDRKVVGAPSATGLFPRRHSVSLPSAKFSKSQFVNRLKRDPPVLLGSSCINNKENHFRERSFSELGDRLWPGSQACVDGSSQVNSSRYKTELCRPFEENSTCKYGDKCQFAHGMHELRSLSRHPKYKTELCRTFHTSGFCPYGPRCHFIHNAEERRGPPPLSAFNKMERPRLQHSFSFAGFPSSNSQQDCPTSITPPPMFSTKDLIEWRSNSFAHSSQDLASPFFPSLGPSPMSEPQGLTPPSPTTPYLFQPTSEISPSPPDSLSDQEGYQSSLGSQSGSESPLLDASRRLPIFSRLSVSDE
ncbi:LOW QUALITY PROTEIN: mRNA decay activator protein ZFP36L1b [Anoplopoma fimbria]|uniref:LOW QUALITY PROTEIN: mRNA decay activator protein ZFP36L1b n=1 Tax=Anoplopoma fimbria TaxID=229290 RepID=UPI0023EC9B0A|nr:LOW QUALITY PROTEIN: mRNA decay activator protein ZFP36L1b [Anoplopoma fimbria]